jgi:hypothetical protein
MHSEWLVDFQLHRCIRGNSGNSGPCSKELTPGPGVLCKMASLNANINEIAIGWMEQ